MKTYCIHANYQDRLDNKDWDDTTITSEEQELYQKDVYEFALSIARANGLKRIFDVGCGSGKKLVKYFPPTEFTTIGSELPGTVRYLKQVYPDREWVDSENFGEAPSVDLVICSDVIEHLKDPDILLDYIARTGASWIVISTVDRDQLNSYDGPPWNLCHVREWSIPEFEQYISQSFEVVQHFSVNELNTTQVVLCRPR